MSMARKAVLGAAGLTAAGYGTYFLVQQQEISRHQSEVANWSQHVAAEHKAIKNSQQQIQEQEARMKQLSQHEVDERAAEKATEVKLQEARDLVARLEAEYLNKQSSAAKAAADGKTAATRLRNLRADAERAREALTVGEQSLKIARQRASEAQKLTNPLNHPRVAELLGRR